jgi:hypothetical protein
MPNNLMNGATAVASFLGIGRGQTVRADNRTAARRAARAETDDLSGEDDAEGDPDEAARRAAGQQQDPDDDSNDSDPPADPNPNNPRDSQNDPQDSEDDNNSDDEDDDETADEDDPSMEMRGRNPLAAARRRERARCAAIFGCAAAGQNVDYAAYLAFNTKLGRNEAIRMLKAAPKGPSSLSNRMASHAGQRVGASAPGSASTPSNIASSWDRAFKAARRSA